MIINYFKKKFTPAKSVQIANYLIYLSDDFYKRQRYIYWDAVKIHTALFYLDIINRKITGDFLFKDESKTIGWHGIYYNDVVKYFGISANIPIYKSYQGNKEMNYIKYLSFNEQKDIEKFLEKNYLNLHDLLFEGNNLIALLSEKTQEHLNSVQFPEVSNDILEELYKSLEREEIELC